MRAARGVLRVVEVYGAALLAEEMEQTSRWLSGSETDARQFVDGLDALMRASVQLPTYLERVLGGGRDLALVLLPLLNDLRAVRGAPAPVRGHAALAEPELREIAGRARGQRPPKRG
jgi:chemosensory pili system protein ChpA (sensor histidine kinase/response regulator)